MPKNKQRWCVWGHGHVFPYKEAQVIAKDFRRLDAKTKLVKVAGGWKVRYLDWTV